jgi:CRISPR-associated protein Csd2
MTALNNKYDFILLFDVTDGNPNGDPDADNMPRRDYETGHGIVTDVCIKHKIRNYVEQVKKGEDGYDLYIKSGISLNTKDNQALDELGVPKSKTKSGKKDKDTDKKIKEYMCHKYFDIRTFGAVMTTFTQGALNSGQITGPVQLTFARSVDPITVNNYTLTRCVITKEDEAETKNNTMGKKPMVYYGLYKMYGHINANLANDVTHFSEEDLELLWQAIEGMFELDHAAARGTINLRELIIFKHESVYGNCASYKLFDRVHITKKDGVVYPREYSDYTVDIDTKDMPANVTLIRRG